MGLSGRTGLSGWVVTGNKRATNNIPCASSLLLLLFLQSMQYSRVFVTHISWGVLLLLEVRRHLFISFHVQRITGACTRVRFHLQRKQKWPLTLAISIIQVQSSREGYRSCTFSVLFLVDWNLFCTSTIKQFSSTDDTTFYVFLGKLKITIFKKKSRFMFSFFPRIIFDPMRFPKHITLRLFCSEGK